MRKGRPAGNKGRRRGGGIMEIPGLLDSQVVKIIIQQRKQAGRERDTSSGDVQILGQLVGACKNQLITIAQAGMRKLQLCTDQEGKEEAIRKRQEFLKVAWGGRRRRR